MGTLESALGGFIYKYNYRYTHMYMRNSSARRYACRISRKWCQTLTYKLLAGRVETKEFPSHFPLNAKEDTATFFLMLGYRSNCLHEETDIGF